MIIDFHTHVFPDKMAEKTIRKLAERSHIVPASYGRTQELLSSMEEAGIDCSVILPVVTAPSQFSTVNKFSGELNAAYQTKDRRLVAFGGIHPDTPDYKGELKELHKRGFKGIKLHPDYQGVMIDDIRNMRIVEYASELDMIVSVHAGVDIGLPEPVHCTPKAARRLLDEVRPSKLVLAHYGGWKQWDQVEEVLVGQDVYFDTAFTFGYIDKEQFVRILRNHGSDKILFATDCPWANQIQFVEALDAMPLTQKEKEQVFYKNAEKLLFGMNGKN